ncbi:MAG: type I DNA topoisomerase [Patescibacteria group bacterium]
MSYSLVIVESPAKAKTISKYLGSKYKVLSSFGHVRDLPQKEIGVDTEHGFIPKYVVSRDKMKQVKLLKEGAAKADEILFATDEDREGEAISWHLAQILKVDPAKLKRITFHEITKRAIDHAIENPRNLDLNLVNAQQARRILDRLVGYELSPFLWRKVQKGLSAGRVQSVTVRLVVEREREREAFKPQDFWTIDTLFNKDQISFPGKLHAIGEKKLDKLGIDSEVEAEKILEALKNGKYEVAEVTKKTVKRSPAPPFTTSTLQQEGNNKLGFGAKETMMLAQKLYEGVTLPGEGQVALVTYMRTDSTNLSELFINEARTFISDKFGADYLLDKPRIFKTKDKGAQEAHEAIRPTDASRTPDSIKDALDRDLWRLYDLIWRRAVATQLPEAIFDSTSADIATGEYIFRSTGSTIKFDGFLKVYEEKRKDSLLPELAKGDAVALENLESKKHTTEPPARYSDASLVKALEEHGIGRPSTYAPTISTILERGYVERDEAKKLKPNQVAYTVTDLLVEHFPNIVDLAFTAKMEKDLDQVAEGKAEWVPVLQEFYGPFHDNLKEKEKSVVKLKPADKPTDQVCEKCGKPMVIRGGRFGDFLACSGFPECKNTKPLAQNANGEAVAAEPEVVEDLCPTCGAAMIMKRGRFGPFISCSKYPECKTIKKIEKKTGVKCPQCGEGEIVEKKGRSGRPFFSCNRYPDCKFALWQKPTGEKCPTCSSLMTFAAKGMTQCSNKECGFKKSLETSETPET